MHAGADPRRVSPIGASMSAQPRFGRAMTSFARHAFIRMRGRGESIGGSRLKWRMTNRAARTRLRLRDAQGFTNPGRARVEENGVGVSVKIFLRPGDVLAPSFAGAAMTTGRLTSDRPDEFSVGFGRLL